MSSSISNNGRSRTNFGRVRLLASIRFWIGSICLVALSYSAWSFSQTGANGAALASQAVWQEVNRADLEVVVLERGSLESQSNIDLICEVEDVRKDNINGTTIVWMIPNGASVKKGDLVLELDSNPMQEAMDDQVLYLENALAEKIQAEANLKNQQTMNATAKAESELLIRLAELELEMYVDKDNGTQKLAIDLNKRKIDDVNNEILAAQATMELRREEQRGYEELFKLGYANQNEVRRFELQYLTAEGTFAAKLNQLQTEVSTLKKMQVYEQRKEKLVLEGKLATAKRGLEQVLRNNEARLAQVEALMRAKDESFKKEEEKFARFKLQLEKCKIYAPQSGLVAYPNNKTMEVREGLPVIYRQKLLSIPNLDSMQVETRIHESALDQVKAGLPVRVTVDAFPGTSYDAVVKSVAVLPEQNSWSGNDTKVYQTIVTITDKVEGLKPGMTAISEILINKLPDVVTVPLQAVVEKDDKTYVVVKDDHEHMQPRFVELGEASDTRVSIQSGLREGESIAVNAQDLMNAVFSDNAVPAT